jgi:hypothetical protein
MKGANFKILVIALVVLCVAVPVSAKTAYPTDRVIDRNPGPVEAAPNLVDWYENWDSYPTGQDMHGIGGWKGWGNTPAATAYTSDVQRISIPNSIDIKLASDLVHEYPGTTDGVWTYTAWQFVPPLFNGETYFLLLNQYDDPGNNLNWSLQVSFDSAADLVTNDGPVGGTLPLIYDQWVEIRVEIDLDNNWQQVYYGGNLLFEGSWSEGMSGGGITSIGAVDLFANGASSVYYDDLSLVKPVQNQLFINRNKIFQHPSAPSVVKVVTQWEIYDQNGMPVEGALMAGEWTLPDGTVVPAVPFYGLTDVLGHEKFRLMDMQTGVYNFCVTSITKADYFWDPGDPLKCLSINIE